VNFAHIIGLGTNIVAGETMRNAQSETKNNIIWESDGFAAVLPSDKREVVMTLRNHFGLVTGMTGDGVNDAPALSAAQVGIAVDGATDAAKNAADLILTEPGLSPIYGAVLESRRIFARIKAYVIYRVAASVVLVSSLSIIIFVTGCSVGSLYVIILALLNDVSMIPVAYDNAKATTKPQLPKARSLVYQSAFYGVVQAFLTIMFIFSMDYDKHLFQDIDLHQCTPQTSAFIWLHLVFCTELMIFSVRAPGFMLFSSMPSWKLVVSVICTCGIGIIIAMFSADFWLAGENVGWVLLFNVASLIVVDILKVQFRYFINEEPGETIDTDELRKAPKRTETEKKVKKDMRYVVHNESIMPKEDREHVVEVRRKRSRSSLAGFFDIGTGEHRYLSMHRLFHGFFL
jgi:H+-transporting ATPase